MDGSAFDALSLAVARSDTRRRLLRLLIGLPLAGWLAIHAGESDVAARGRRGRRHQARHQHRHAQTQRRKNQRDDTHSEACIPTGQRCPSKKPRGKHARKLGCDRCCQGSFVTDASGKKVCGCQPNGGACTTDPASSCCSGFCNGTTCQAAPCSATLPCPQCQTCNAATGLCEAIANDGTACNDGNACTQTDTCQGGRCVGTDPVVCPGPPDACHLGGLCNPATGLCGFPTQLNGSACDDGNACTTGETCQNGICGNGTPVANGTVCGAGGDAAFCCQDGNCPTPSACLPGGSTCGPTSSDCLAQCCSGEVEGNPGDFNCLATVSGPCESDLDCVAGFSGTSCHCGRCCAPAGNRGNCSAPVPGPEACCSGACAGSVCAA